MVARAGSVACGPPGLQRAAFIFLGDNGGRPIATPRPKLFRDAERRGFRILPARICFLMRRSSEKPVVSGLCLTRGGSIGGLPRSFVRSLRA